MINFIKNYYFYFFIIVTFFLFITGYSYAYPIEVVPDEVGQLKNIYGMIKSKSLSLHYFSSYSIWTHYIYIIPVLIYWGMFYLISDLQSIAELQYYILNNYYQVVPFLRVFTALLFLISLIYIREVLKNILNTVQANIFFIFISLNLLIVINTHYAKHWMIDTALIFFALYLYYKYNINRKKLKYAFFSFFLFSFGVLSSYPLILSGIYFLLIYFYFNKGYKLLFKDILIYTLVFTLMIIYTINMGFGGIVSAVNNNLNFSFDVFFRLLGYTLDYDPFLTIFFVLSLYLLIYKKNIKFLLALIPYFGYLISLSFYGAEPRYALFLIIDSAFLATFFLKYLYDNHIGIFKMIFSFYIIFNLTVVISWLNIITKIDTRVETRNWLKNNITKDDFVIYNTWGFNYVPLTKESINTIKSICPSTISTREELHLQYNLQDGINGVILWKIDQSKDCNIVKIVESLQKKHYQVIFINEKFGKIAKFDQPSKKSFRMIQDKFILKSIKEYSPYKNNPSNVEEIGDIILNFEYVLNTMYHLKQSGPKINIYEVQSEDK